MCVFLRQKDRLSSVQKTLEMKSILERIGKIMQHVTEQQVGPNIAELGLSHKRKTVYYRQ